MEHRTPSQTLLNYSVLKDLLKEPSKEIIPKEVLFDFKKNLFFHLLIKQCGM